MSEPFSLGAGVSPVAGTDPSAARPTSCEWLVCLRAAGARHDKAVRHVHELTRRAARQQLIRMPHVWEELGAVRAEEIIEAAADEATMAVLHNLDGFQGRSRFSTWVYKFGVFHAASEARRALWRDRAFVLDDDDDLVDGHPLTPESSMEARDLSGAVAVAIQTALTAHQRRVVLALLIDGVPIDVLAERLGTSRNTLYKALHDARVRLRGELVRRGYLHDSPVPKAAAR